MNAYQLFDAAVDNANNADTTQFEMFGFNSGITRPSASEQQKLAKEFIQYADSVFDIVLPARIANTMINCMLDYHDAMQKNGEYSNNYFNCIQKPLEEIEIVNNASHEEIIK